jgi:hypothetical protein
VLLQADWRRRSFSLGYTFPLLLAILWSDKVAARHLFRMPIYWLSTQMLLALLIIRMQRLVQYTVVGSYNAYPSSRTEVRSSLTETPFPKASPSF